MFNHVSFFKIAMMLLSFTLANGQYMGNPGHSHLLHIISVSSMIRLKEFKSTKLIPSLVVTNLQDCGKFVHNFQSLSNFLDVFSLPHSNWPALDYTSKHLLITEVEMSPPNKKYADYPLQWIEVYNPTNNTFFMPLGIGISNETEFLFESTLFPSHQFKILNFSNADHTTYDKNHALDGGSIILSLLPYPDSPLVLQKTVNRTQIAITPALNDSLSTSETWQIGNNGNWVFMGNTPLDATKNNPVHSFVPVDKSEHLSPLKQFKTGIETKDIQCKKSLELIVKITNGHPACVKPETKQKLIERGWAKSS